MVRRGGIEPHAFLPILMDKFRRLASGAQRTGVYMIKDHLTKTKGDLGVAATIFDLTLKGYHVSVPLTEHAPYDLIADTGEKLIKIQVKYRTDGIIPTSNSWADKNGSHRVKYEGQEFDYFALYIPTKNIVCYAPISLVGRTLSFEIPTSPTPFYWYEDFLTIRDTIPEKKSYKDFGVELSKVCSDRNKGVAHYRARKVERPSKEELHKLIWEKPTIKVALVYGVSDHAISKWCKTYGISKPPRGYWSKTGTLSS